MEGRRLTNGVRVHLTGLTDTTGTQNARQDPGLLPDDDRLPKSIRDLVPTPLVQQKTRRNIALETPRKVRRWRALWCLGLLIRYFLSQRWDRLLGRATEDTSAIKARILFERLGGMWIKLGQLLSLRTDLFSEAMCRELSALQYQIGGFPSDMALEVVETDLGQPLNKLFSQFDHKPFAAASICQVHRAVLRESGRAVVVKIMRPGVAEMFRRDVQLLQGFATAMKLFGQYDRLHLKEAMREIRSLFQEETDYTYEMAYLMQMRKVLKAHDVIVPRVYPEFCGTRVLVMQEIPGVLMSHYIEMRRDDPAKLRAWERDNGISPKTLAKTLLITTMRQILEDNQFHGDLHPGNIMLLTDNRIALIDFGTVGSLERQQWFIYRQVTEAQADRDYERAADYMLMLGQTVPATGVDDLRRELADMMRVWVARGDLSTLGYHERSMGSLSNDMAKVMARYKAPPSWAMMRVGRALGTLDASLQVLSPDGNFLKLFRAYFKDRQKRSSSFAGRKAQVVSTFREVNAITSDAKILLAPQIRKQSMLLRGMADTVTQIRIRILRALKLGATVFALLFVLGYIADEHNDRVNRGLETVVGDDIQIAERYVLDLTAAQWVLIVAGLLFLRFVFRTAQRALIERR